jgi:hypothetical protein
MWILISDKYAAEYAITLKQLGLTICSWIIWFESFGVNCSRGFNRCSRHLFYCVHWLDCLVGSAVAASMQGCVRFGTDGARPKKQCGRLSFRNLQRMRKA